MRYIGTDYGSIDYSIWIVSDDGVNIASLPLGGFVSDYENNWEGFPMLISIWKRNRVMDQGFISW